MSSELQHPRAFSQSKLYMWRTVIAIAHADGDVCVDERAYLESVFERMRDSAGLDDISYALLIADLDTAQDAMDMLKKVEDHRYRGQLLHFAQMLAAKDGIICDKEQALLDRMHEEISKDMDVDPITDDDREALRDALNSSAQKQHGQFVALMEKFISSTGLKD